MGEIGKATGTRILAWVLMDNHAHVLLFSGNSGLPKFMRRLLTGYAVWFNRRHQRLGHLFQNRYKSIVCEEDQYLLELVRYIHLNPVRSHMVGNMEELDRYRWSGHGVLVGKVRCDLAGKNVRLGSVWKGRKAVDSGLPKVYGRRKGIGEATGVGWGRIGSESWGVVEGVISPEPR
jgi:REP element-mobilizing transposase RayT